MRVLRLSFWAFVLPPLPAGRMVCAQTAAPMTADGWQTATPASAAPAPTLQRPVPVEVAPLAGPAPGWSAAPAGKPADTAPPALRSAPLTETAAPPAQPAPVTMAAPAPAPLPPVLTAPTAPATMASAPVTRAPVGKTYGPQRLAFADGVSAQFDVTCQTLRGFRPLTLDLYQPRPRGYALPRRC